MSADILLSAFKMMSVVCYRMDEYWILQLKRNGKNLASFLKPFYKGNDRSHNSAHHFQRDPTLYH